MVRRCLQVVVLWYDRVERGLITLSYLSELPYTYNTNPNDPEMDAMTRSYTTLWPLQQGIGYAFINCVTGPRTSDR
jgi:hypothetical protein